MPTENELLERILKFRKNYEYTKAVKACKVAIDRFPDNCFFHMIAGDLYYLSGEYSLSCKSYIDFLFKMPDNYRLFGQFANRYYRIRKKFTDKDFIKFVHELYISLTALDVPGHLKIRGFDLISNDLRRHEFLSNEASQIAHLFQDDRKLNNLINKLRKLELSDSLKLEMLLDTIVLTRKRDVQYYRIDSYCLSIYERLGNLQNALKIAEELIEIKFDYTIARSFFRLCRKMKNYEKAKTLISRTLNIESLIDFNILYELVYYFEFLDDFDQIRRVLSKMEKSGAESIPIQNTVKNFYLRFGLLEDANRATIHISKLYSEKGKYKFAEELQESEAGVSSKIRELYSELEHQKQLAAIRDLTSGISHELGQPITNIRYTIQFYRKIFEKEIDREVLFNIFDSILEETKRMGGIIKRLSPITSGKSIDEEFDIVERIKMRLTAESARLKHMGVTTKVSPQKAVIIYGDPSKFDQIINNLLLNSIGAFKTTSKPGTNRIHIRTVDQKDNIKIIFTDTGEGIPAKFRGKIFDPFFTTKPPGKGEGLGLFIVWNIIKYMGGNISLDPNYLNGVRFCITFPKTGQKDKE